MARIACVLAGLLGCYQPAGERACKTTCSAVDPRCPNGTTCGGDLRCHALGAVECSVDPQQPDAAVDAVVPQPGCYGYALPNFNPVCDLGVVPPTLALDPALSTNAGNCIKHTQEGGLAVCVLVATNLVVNTHIRVSGSIPLVLIATDTLTVTDVGVLDASSSGSLGPNANPGDCPPHAGESSLSGGGGGGAGGSLGGVGGPGGSGGGGGAGGPPTMVIPISTLRGGCGGSTGGIANVGGTPTPGGSGGGAIYLIAGTALDVAGSIWAGGTGGAVGAVGNGGGGGGSGGMIVLEAPMVKLAASTQLFADGGGGSGGVGASVPTSGGEDAGGPTFFGRAAAGGPTSDAGGGGVGGAGSYTPNPRGVGGSNAGSQGAGGGGGGGGAGYVITRGAVSSTGAGALISPSPTSH